VLTSGPPGEAMIERFPTYKIPFLIDVGNYCLFGTPPDMAKL
jgi:hypothetical protein